MNTMIKTTLAVLSILVIAVCSVLVFGRVVKNARLADLTEKKIYTLSQGTKNVLGKLNQPVTLKLYYTRSAALDAPEGIRQYINYSIYVSDLLNEFSRVAGGKVHFVQIDPRPNTEEEDDAVKYGLQRIPLGREKAFIFGLVASTEYGRTKSIKFFDLRRQEFVEYEIAKLIVELIERDKSKVGIISSLPVTGSDTSPYMMQMMRMQGRQPEQPWHLVSGLKSRYEVEKVEIKDDAPAVPEDIDYLMVIHPKDLNKKTLFAIDQYVMKGGKLIVFTDPHCLSDRPPQPQRGGMPPPDHKSSSDLNALLEKWGATMEDKKIAVDRELAVSVPLGQGEPSPFFPFMELTDKCVNKEEVITSSLHSLRILFAGKIKKNEKAGTEFVPLLKTTNIGSTWTPKDKFALQYPNADTVRKEVIDGDEPVVLACLLKGKFKSNYPEGIDPPKKEEPKKDDKAKKEEPKKPEVVKECKEENSVIVVSDVDFITDQFAFQNTFIGPAVSGDNFPFVLNTLEFLGGNTDLVSIRSRGSFSRPFTLFEKMEREAGKESAKKIDELKKKQDEYNKQIQEVAKKTGNAALVQNEAIKKQNQLEQDKLEVSKQIRELKKKRREGVEKKKSQIILLNVFVIPFVLAILFLLPPIVRFVNAKSARRN